MFDIKITPTILLFFIFLPAASFSQSNISVANTKLTNCQKSQTIMTKLGMKICCLDAGHPQSCTPPDLATETGHVPTNLNGLKAAKMIKTDLSEFRTEFSSFCATFMKKLNLQIVKPVTLADPGSKVVDLQAVSEKQKLTLTTPCGTIATESKQEFQTNFPSAIRKFCTDMKIKYPAQQSSKGPIVFGTVKIPESISATDSCILGNVELNGNHRLQNAVIIGTGEVSKLMVATSGPLNDNITWSGIYFGQGSLTQNPKQKIESGMSGGIEETRNQIIELSTFQRFEIRNPGTGVKLPAPNPAPSFGR